MPTILVLIKGYGSKIELIDAFENVQKNKEKINEKPGFLLENSYQNLLQYLTETKFYANIDVTKRELEKMDRRRNLDSKKVFPKLYQEVLN